MKKQLSVSLLSLCLMVIMFVGSSLAWFSDDAYYVDVMTTGNVQISQRVTDISSHLLVPRATAYEKEVIVTNEGNTPCFVRTLVAFEDSENVLNSDNRSVVDYVSAFVGDTRINIDKTLRFKVKVTKGNEVISTTYYTVGIYTHEKALEKSGNNELSRVETMSTIQIAPDADNAWCDAVGNYYDILVLSQATQATGWAKVNDNGTERDITAAEAFKNAFDAVSSETVAYWFSIMIAEQYANTGYSVTVEPYPAPQGSTGSADSNI